MEASSPPKACEAPVDDRPVETPPTDADVKTPTPILIRAAQIDAHFRLMPVVLIINGIVPPIYFLVAQDAIDLRHAALWQVGLIVVLLARMLLRSLYTRRRPGPRRVLVWGRWSTAGSLLTGLLWGAMSVLLWPAEVPEQLLLGATLAGMTAGAVGSLTPFFPPFLAYVPTSLLPYTAMALIAGERVTLGAGGLLVLFLVAMLAMARILNRNFVASIELRFENIELLRDLAAQKQAADAANQAKSDFIAAVSHDLRQPVHALNLFVAALRERVREPAALDIMRRMDSSVRAMQNLFTALLDISRLDAGVVQPRRRDFALQALFDRIAIDSEFDAEARQIGLGFRATDAVAHSDPELVEVIVRNLVSNALAYTRAGRVLVACRDAGDAIRIQVWDQGIGIAPEHQARIFQDYYQVTATTPKAAGRAHVGLGLAIVMRLVHVLGHTLELRSQLDRGSVFTLTLPRGRTTGTTPHRPGVVQPASLAGAFIVVIDDEADIRQAMERLLDGWGCRVITGENYAATARLFGDEAGVPALLISDYNLGLYETGVEAAQAIREEYNTDLPVLLMTGESDPGRLRRIHGHGYPVLHKPIAPATLRSTMEELIR
ncbi:MAG: hybrid sensor histidine kinase/response regulator [Gammaproteobacteria bacterium]